MRKAQTATEYLIILSVVIIIALIVVSILGGVPAIGGSLRSGTSAGYWKTSQIAVESVAINDSGNGTLRLRNNFADTIQITEVRLVEANGTSASNTTPTILASGAIGYWRVDGLTPATAGNSYSINLLINYTDTVTNANYLFPQSGAQAITGAYAKS